MKDHSRKQTTRLNRGARRPEGSRQTVHGFSLTQYHYTHRNVRVDGSKGRHARSHKSGGYFVPIDASRLWEVLWFALTGTGKLGWEMK